MTTVTAVGGPAAATRAVHAEVAEQTGVALPVRLWDGTELGDPHAGFRLDLTRPWSLRALLLPPGDLAAGEAYLAGDIEIEGDIVAAMAVAARTARRLPGRAVLRLLPTLLALPAPPHPAPARARLHGRPHSRSRDRAAIAYHYDLPQAFYETFLDADLVYSCAYYADPAESLEVAQRRKLEVVCRKLRLRAGSRLLDIGCGWGSLVLHAARHHGAQALGVTLSRTQAEAARRRVERAGLGHLVEVRLADYREVEGTFDAVASIGMLEHVGPEHLPGYLATVARLTAPGGLTLQHGIVMGDADRVRTGRERTFVSAHVFPDGGLVPAWRLARDVQRAGFELLDVEQLRPSYALTLREWVRRLEAARDRAVAAAGEVRYRTWRAYMGASAYSFEERSLGVVQVLGGRAATVPLGRDWMLPPPGAPT